MTHSFEQELSTVKKKTDAPEQISKEEFIWRARELKKCRDDIVYFANKYYRIISPDVNGGKGGLGVISTYPKQEDLLHFIEKYNRCIVLASRQSGKCVYKKVNITIRNKNTGEIKEIPIEEFYKMIKSKKENE